MVEREIFYTKGRSISLSYSNKALKRREEISSQGYGIRVVDNGGLGFSYAEREDDVEKATETAVKMAKYSPRPDFYFPGKSVYPSIKVKDEKIAQMDAMQLKEVFEKVKEGAEKYSGNSQISIEIDSDFFSIENSAGFSGECGATSIQAGVEVMDDNGFGFFSNAFPNLPDADEFYKIGEIAAERARETKNPKKIDSGDYIVVFEPEALDDLMDILLPSFSGEWKKRKISYLHDKIGQDVFSEKLSIHDNPLMEEGVNSQPFDDEGVPSEKITLIDKGTAKNFIYNVEVASLEGVKDKGRCSRPSYDSMPGIGFSNIVVDTGDLSEDEGDISVVSFHGSHTANTTTGDFGIEVNSAFLTKNGKREPIRDFMITGNIFKLFKNIYGIGKRQRKLGTFFAPRIAFSDVQVIG